MKREYPQSYWTNLNNGSVINLGPSDKNVVKNPGTNMFVSKNNSSDGSILLYLYYYRYTLYLSRIGLLSL